jgi:CRISPR-associated protein (Cas_Csd1)
MNRGYLLGRVFALLARLEVLEGRAEELYQNASARPPQVLPKAIATAIAAGKGEELFPLLSLLPVEAFDNGLNWREQGAFVIGYAHESTGVVLPKREEESEDGEQGLTERYELRVDPQLKEWLKNSGGGSFVRTLLRTERERQNQGESSQRL